MIVVVKFEAEDVSEVLSELAATSLKVKSVNEDQPVVLHKPNFRGGNVAENTAAAVRREAQKND